MKGSVPLIALSLDIPSFPLSGMPAHCGGNAYVAFCPQKNTHKKWPRCLIGIIMIVKNYGDNICEWSIFVD